MVDITKAIREVDQKHIIIIEGNGWGNNYNGILPPWDNNMVLSYHKYWSYNDQASAAHMIKMRDKYNIPVWLGETGENSNVWFTEAIRLFETNNIGWAWWPLKKIGSNNPMEIKSNLNYDSVVGYINGGGNKPKESNVYSGVMEMAAYTRFENTIVHNDVIDAMMRQPFSAETRPFKKHLLLNNAIINAVDYDLGRNGHAYFDKDTADYHVSNGKHTGGNRGRSYRNDGVDIAKDANKYGAHYVYNIESGEWLNYTFEVKKRGNYTLKLKVASDNDKGSISLTVDGSLVAGDVTVPNTGGMTNFEYIEIKNISLKNGKQTLKVLADVGSFNFSEFQFTK